MTPLPSIAARLLRAQLLWSIVWTLVITAAVWLAVSDEVRELQDETLEAAAEVLSGSLGQFAVASNLPGRAGSAKSGGRPTSAEQFAWQVVRYGSTESAKVLSASPRAPIEAFYPVPLRGFGDSPAWRIFGMPLGSDGRMLYVAQTSADRTEALFEVALAAALASLAIALLAHFWLRAQTRQELVPLQNLAGALAVFDPLQPGAAMGAAERQELQVVHNAIDDLGQRLARRVDAERAFSGHAAHALRTPLAGIDAQLAVALRECPPELTARLQQIRAASNRLQSVVASLLSLFRSGSQLQLAPVDLQDWLPRLVPKGLNLQIAPAQPLTADVDLLSAALLNVFDNAVRAGARQVSITQLSPHVLRVHDDGSGVSAERRLALIQAVQSQRYEGVTGLGLMLADIVARAHGGRLELPVVSSGFAVEFHLARTTGAPPIMGVS